MSRDTAPAYVVEVDTPGYRWTPAPWEYKRHGKPTDAKLTQYVKDFEASTRPGGVNKHLGATRVAAARVRRNQLGGDVVASYTAAAEPMFTVVS